MNPILASGSSIDMIFFVSFQQKHQVSIRVLLSLNIAHPNSVVYILKRTNSGMLQSLKIAIVEIGVSLFGGSYMFIFPSHIIKQFRIFAFVEFGSSPLP